jgi:integrase
MSKRKDGRCDASKMSNGRRVWGYGPTQEDADEDLARKLAEILEPSLTGSSTLREFAREAWSPMIANKLEATRRRYMAAYRHVDQALGAKPIESITAQNCQRFINELKTKQVSRSGKGKVSHEMDPTTIRFTAGVFTSILSLAVDMGLISRSPMSKRLVSLPKRKEKRERFLHPDNALEMLEAAPPRLQCAIFLGAFLGLRRGEICGLKWSDIDRQQRTIRIQRQRTNKGDFQALKTTSSKRTLTVPNTIIEILDQLGDLDHPVHPVPCSPRDLTYAWNQWEKRPKDWTFHDLRHGAAGLLNYVTRGDVLAVKAILGHSNIDTTMLYTAEASTRSERAFEALGTQISSLTTRKL